MLGDRGSYYPTLKSIDIKSEWFIVVEKLHRFVKIVLDITGNPTIEKKAHFKFRNESERVNSDFCLTKLLQPFPDSKYSPFSPH